MFSDHLPKRHPTPAKTLLLIAAGVAIFCQLVAMVMVAVGQVEKAQQREAGMASARAAAAWCMQSSRGAALKDCDHVTATFSDPSGADRGNPTPQGMALATLVNRY